MKNGYQIIDAHCHIYPDKIAARATAGTGRFYNYEPFGDGTTAGLRRLGGAAGSDHFIVQSVATNARQVRSINEFIADEVARSGGKFTGLGTLYPGSPDLAGDYAHLKSLGLCGVKLHPDIQQFKIDDYRCLKIYEMCERDGMVILMHTGDSRYDYSNPNRLLPIMQIYTGLTVIAAHLGGWSVWAEADRTLRDLPNLYVDTSSSIPMIPKEQAIAMIHHYGVDHVLYGTDYPMWSPQREIDAFFALGLTDAENRAILCENAQHLFDIAL